MIPPSTIAQAKAEICGLIATVAVNRDEGGKLAMRMRAAFERVERIIDELAAEAAGPLPITPEKGATPSGSSAKPPSTASAPPARANGVASGAPAGKPPTSGPGAAAGSTPRST